MPPDRIHYNKLILGLKGFKIICYLIATDTILLVYISLYAVVKTT